MGSKNSMLTNTFSDYTHYLSRVKKQEIENRPRCKYLASKISIKGLSKWTQIIVVQTTPVTNIHSCTNLVLLKRTFV